MDFQFCSIEAAAPNESSNQRDSVPEFELEGAIRSRSSSRPSEPDESRNENRREDNNSLRSKRESISPSSSCLMDVRCDDTKLVAFTLKGSLKFASLCSLADWLKFKVSSD